MRQSSTSTRRSGVGLLLQHWRVVRGLSQLALATEAGISARHLGFIEIGRTCPSRDMVLLLAATLDIPLPECDILLLAAGYAPMRRTSEIVSSDQLARIRAPLEYLLKKHEPFPALVTDRHWNLLMTNRSSRRLFGLFLDARPSNTLSVCFDPAGLRPFITNWQTLASAHVQQLHREILASPSSEEASALLDELLSFPSVPAAWGRFDATAVLPSLLPFDLRRGDLRANFLSAFTSFSMPQEAAQLGVRIECMYPADPSTDAFVRALAEKA